MYESILVPYDKSDHARNALEHAVKLAQLEPDCKITVLYVAELSDFTDPTFVVAVQMSGFDASDDKVTGAQQEYYAETKKRVAEDIAPVIGDYPNLDIVVLSGRPQDVIVEMATTGNYDLIAMGCRGLGALRGALGSVSFAVLRSVDIPVLVVK